MNSRRAFFPVLALAWAIAAPAWGSTSGGVGPTDAPATPTAAPTAQQGTGSAGGAEATTVHPGAGGGGAAPTGTGEQPPATVPPDAVAAQDPTPTTPEGEPQDPEPELPDDEDTPTDEQPSDDGDEPADQDDEAGAVLPNDGDGTSTLGFLPSTGLEVAALALIGLGLMIAGFALLRPTARPRRARTLR